MRGRSKTYEVTLLATMAVRACSHASRITGVEDGGVSVPRAPDHQRMHEKESVRLTVRRSSIGTTDGCLALRPTSHHSDVLLSQVSSHESLEHEAERDTNTSLRVV